VAHFAAHERAEDTTVEWLTPPSIVHALGPFDLDPCSPKNRPWSTAAKHYTREDDGLAQPWAGRVWLNPPYGAGMDRWLAKLAEHGNGIAFIFARTETAFFQRYVWSKADALFFVAGRVSFHDVSGAISTGGSGAPSVLIAYGEQNVEALRRFKARRGFFVDLRLQREERRAS
jgi:hypothetical protein